MNPILEIQIEPYETKSDTCVIKTNRVVAKTPEYFSTVEEASARPLGQLLVQIEGLEAVLLQDRIVTLLKPSEGPPWGPIAERASELIQTHFEGLERIQKNRARQMNEEEKELFVEIQNLLNDEMNPMVAAHGGFIEVVDVKETDIFVHMGGGCQGCGMAAMTLRQGVETLIRQKVPRVKNIHDSTDHEAGDNPFYE